MTVDTEKDLEGLKRIGRIVGLALKAMLEAIRPGMTTAELDELGEALLSRYGARSAPRLVYNFPGSTCISINDQAAHGIPGGRIIQPGDLVNIDISAELDGYFADTAATLAVAPAYPLQEKLCRFARRALERAIDSAQAGRRMNVIGRAVEKEARRGGFSILRDLTGHGIGHTIHEDPHHVFNFFRPGEDRRLQEGMVITIEPFLSTGATNVITAADGWTLQTPDGSLSAQFEHTVVIGHGRPIVLTAV